MHIPIDPPHPPQPLLSLRLDRNMSPPQSIPMDQELMQLQMVQSMIKQEPKLDLAQVILDAVAASTRAASKNFADIFNCNNDSNSDHRRQQSEMNSNNKFDVIM